MDSSALVKLIFDEAESASLGEWLRDRAELPKITSELPTIELLRVCTRVDADLSAEARQLIAGIDLIPMTGAMVERAAAVGPALHTLDAIHLASALEIDGLIAVVTYDARLAAAAADEQLSTAAPS